MSRVPIDSGAIRDLVYRVRYPSQEDPRPVVCMYHSISDGPSCDWGPWQYSVSPSTFEQQISWLSEHTSIVTIQSLVEYLQGERSLPANPVVLTFDDGFHDFVTNARPILTDYEAPSIVYVSTGLVDEQRAAYEFRLAEALRRFDGESITISIDGSTTVYSLSTPSERAAAYRDLRPSLKDSTLARRNAVLEEFDAPNAERYRIVNRDELRDIGTDPLVTVGSHGHAHRPLGELRATAARQNVRESRDFLREVLDTPSKQFSYPYGSSSPSVREVVRELGFDSGVTTEERTVKPRDWLNRFTIPRIDMSRIGRIAGTDLFDR